MEEPLIDKLKNTLTDNELINLRKLIETLNKPITKPNQRWEKSCTQNPPLPKGEK